VPASVEEGHCKDLSLEQRNSQKSLRLYRHQRYFGRSCESWQKRDFVTGPVRRKGLPVPESCWQKMVWWLCVGLSHVSIRAPLHSTPQGGHFRTFANATKSTDRRQRPRHHPGTTQTRSLGGRWLPSRPTIRPRHLHRTD
jgi:hypothetical protein